MLYVVEVGRNKHEETVVVECNNVMEAENFAELNMNIQEYKYAVLESPSRSELAYAKFDRPLCMLDRKEIEVIDEIRDAYLEEEFYYDINPFDVDNLEHRRIFELQDRIPFGKDDII